MSSDDEPDFDAVLSHLVRTAQVVDPAVVVWDFHVEREDALLYAMWSEDSRQLLAEAVEGA